MTLMAFSATSGSLGFAMMRSMSITTMSYGRRSVSWSRPKPFPVRSIRPPSVAGRDFRRCHTARMVPDEKLSHRSPLRSFADLLILFLNNSITSTNVNLWPCLTSSKYSSISASRSRAGIDRKCKRHFCPGVFGSAPPDPPTGAHASPPTLAARLARRGRPAGTPRRTAARGLDRSRRIGEGRWGALGRRPGRGSFIVSTVTI